MDNGCLCQSCGRRYKVDLLLPDELWKEITQNSSKLEMLCPACIVTLLEMRDQFASYRLCDTIHQDYEVSGRLRDMAQSLEESNGVLLSKSVATEHAEDIRTVMRYIGEENEPNS